MLSGIPDGIICFINIMYLCLGIIAAVIVIILLQAPPLNNT